MLMLVVVSAWTANRAIGSGDAFDSGLYHYSIVRWNHEHPIVPGLANLLPHYAFNNSCHLFVAMLQDKLVGRSRQSPGQWLARLDLAGDCGDQRHPT
jgi:hypothetical protein